jgi:hypothetical protein
MNQDSTNPQPDQTKDDPSQQHLKDTSTTPGKTHADPDQTPERETSYPPVTDPKKGPEPGKLGFSDTFLLY